MASLYELLMNAQSIMTKQEFGKKMHSPFSTEEEKQEALKAMAEAGGYENLED